MLKIEIFEHFQYRGISNIKAHINQRLHNIFKKSLIISINFFIDRVEKLQRIIWECFVG